MRAFLKNYKALMVVVRGLTWPTFHLLWKDAFSLCSPEQFQAVTALDGHVLVQMQVQVLHAVLPLRCDGRQQVRLAETVLSDTTAQDGAHLRLLVACACKSGVVCWDWRGRVRLCACVQQCLLILLGCWCPGVSCKLAWVAAALQLGQLCIHCRGRFGSS
jgi:hypothetical protein